MNIPQAQQSESTAPEIEDGLYVGRFNDIKQRVVEAFKTDKDKFGNPDDGVRYDFDTTLLDDKRQPVLREDAESPDDTLNLRQAKTIKHFSSDERSNAYFYLKGILTAGEMALWQASGKGDAAADAAWAAAASKINGREVNIQVTHSSTGWPQIEAFLGAAKPLR